MPGLRPSRSPPEHADHVRTVDSCWLLVRQATARRLSMPIILPAVTKPPTTAWRCGSGRARGQVRLAADASMRCRACGPALASSIQDGRVLGVKHHHQVTMTTAPALASETRPPPLLLPWAYAMSPHEQAVRLATSLFADSCALQRPGSQCGGPTCTSARCDLRSGCIGVHAAAMTWRLASQCRSHDRLALSGSMFDRRPSYAKLGLEHARRPYTTPVIALRPTTPARCSRSAKTPNSSIPCP